MTRPATTILVRNVDVTPVLHAIDRAVLRMQSLAGGDVTEYASAAMFELANIALAKQAYDDAADRSARESNVQRAEGGR